MAGNDLFSPTTPEQLTREAEVLVLREMSRSLSAISTELMAQREAQMQIREDIAVMKVRQEENVTIRSRLTTMEGELDKLRDRNIRQDGAYGFVKALKDFGPWLIGLLVLAWGLFERGPR